MKSFIQHVNKNNSSNLPDSPQLVLGKMGVDPNTIPPGPNRERVIQVQKAKFNKISPYSGKVKPNKLGNPKS
jgi:hypothetical protein